MFFFGTIIETRVIVPQYMIYRIGGEERCPGLKTPFFIISIL